MPSSSAGAVYDAVGKIGGAASNEEYTADGDFIVTLTFEVRQESVLRKSLTDATRGSVKFLEIEGDDEM